LPGDKHSLLTAKEVKEQRIRELAQGDAAHTRYDFVVQVWDASEDNLISKTRQIETACTPSSSMTVNA